MRSMVAGAAAPRSVFAAAPSTALRRSPSPVNGRGDPTEPLVTP
jgi:hypothetical protein